MNNFKYKTSKDYNRLVGLMKDQTVICIIDEVRGKWLAETNFDDEEGLVFAVRRDRVYHIFSDTEKDFIGKCEENHVQFLDPKENKRLEESNRELVKALKFTSAVNKSGESWSDTYKEIVSDAIKKGSEV